MNIPVLIWLQSFPDDGDIYGGIDDRWHEKESGLAEKTDTSFVREDLVAKLIKALEVFEYDGDHYQVAKRALEEYRTSLDESHK